METQSSPRLFPRVNSTTRDVLRASTNPSCLSSSWALSPGPTRGAQYCNQGRAKHGLPVCLRPVAAVQWATRIDRTPPKPMLAKEAERHARDEQVDKEEEQDGGKCPTEDPWPTPTHGVIVRQVSAVLRKNREIRRICPILGVKFFSEAMGRMARNTNGVGGMIWSAAFIGLSR